MLSRDFSREGYSVLGGGGGEERDGIEALSPPLTLSSSSCSVFELLRDDRYGGWRPSDSGFLALMSFAFFLSFSLSLSF